MVTMNILRMLADLSLFYSFASFIAFSYGGSNLFAGTLIQCLCFGFSSAAGNRRFLRLTLLLPMGLCWFLYQSSLADCILLIPTTLYIIALVFKGEYILDHSRQAQIFSLFLKIYPIFILFAFLIGQKETLTHVALPFIAAFFITSVFLMRSLRHSPKVYRQKNYQLVNLFVLTLVAAGGCFLGSDFFLGTCLSLLKGFYIRFILPILYLAFAGAALLLTGLIKLFSFVEWKTPQFEQELDLDLLDPSDLLVEMGTPSDLSVIIKQAGIVLGILLICVMIFLFFRWLNGKNANSSREDPIRLVTRTTIFSSDATPPVQDSSVTRSIRALYRKFLKLCNERGIHLAPSSTSLDVDERARNLSGFHTSSAQIREIYIRARYAGRAEKSDLKQIKQLFADSKSQNK